MSKILAKSHEGIIDIFPADLKINSHEYRSLSEQEIEILKKNYNRAQNWQTIFVKNKFNPYLITNSEFYGKVYIGNCDTGFLQSGNLRLPIGINGCSIFSSLIGDSVALKNVAYLSNYQIGDFSILHNIDEISCSTTAKFGNGYLLETDEGTDRFWLEISNENGGRKILPFSDILAADAFLWSRFRERETLNKKLIQFTDNFIPGKNSYGIIGSNCLIKNTKEIIDARIGHFCEITGANTLSNLTIHSSETEPTFIGEDTDIKNAIIGFSNKIFLGPKCENIVTGRNVKIELGARVLNTFISDNSTIACCEVLNNLVFPFHEQHHNNSFLIATTILGQSNIAAGATIGSNHNSRAADGEILAGRGFWPGLESSYKHNCKFASFTLIAKGSYETELNIKLPFALVSKDADSGIVQVFPGFWFRYNMYALARNAWKFGNRDKRKIKAQNIEMEYLAPDSASEMLEGIKIIENAVEQATGKIPFVDEDKFDPKNDLKEIYLKEAAPKSQVLLIKPLQGIWLYKIMLSYFAAREIARFINENGSFDKNKIESGTLEWLNFGGQLIPQNEVDKLMSDIESGLLKSWSDVHDRYNFLWQKYPQQKRNCAIACWLKMNKKSLEQISASDIKNLFKSAEKTSALTVQWTTEAREKDYSNPFRKITYRNQQEMDAVLGKLEDNSFIDEISGQHKQFCSEIKEALKKL